MEQRSLRTGLWLDDKRLGLAARRFGGATNSDFGCRPPIFTTDATQPPDRLSDNAKNNHIPRQAPSSFKLPHR
jgi:hypothetical protein